MKAGTGADVGLSPSSYAVFLRAVNVGTHNRVRMAAVSEAVGGLGYENVRTYLATGNIALTSTEPAEVVGGRIEEALAGLGLKGVDAMVRTRGELAALDGTAFEPYAPGEYRHLAIFTRQPVEIADDLPFAVRGVTVVGVGATVLAVIPREAARPVNANAVVEAVWQTRSTTRWWNVVEDFRRDVLT